MRRFQRARLPEEKALRRKAILVAARKLAREVGPIELGLNELARRSGVSKPNIYRYFESREEILLTLMVAELEELVTELEEIPEDGDVSSMARAIVRGYLSRPLLCQLLGVAASILEHNVTATAIAAAKREIGVLLQRTIAVLTQAMPWLGDGDAAFAAHAIAIYVAGLWPTAHPSRAAAEVLAQPEFAAMRPDASRDLSYLVEVLLRGLEALRRRKRRVAVSDGRATTPAQRAPRRSRSTPTRSA